MYVHVPAMRGKMGSRTYFSCLIPLGAIPAMFKFTDWAGFTAEDREQRVLNTRRIPELKEYMLENENDYIFSSIVASYKDEPIFEVAVVPTNSSSELGVLKLKMGTELIINDGQHRAAGIAEAVKENPKLLDHVISVLLFPWEAKERGQQVFSDLNRYVQKTSKSLDILFDRRDRISAATLRFLELVPTMGKLTDKDNIVLKQKSPKLFTLTALYMANQELLAGMEKEEVEKNAEVLAVFWNVILANMPQWSDVAAGKKDAGEFRAEQVSSHSTILRGVAMVGVDLMKDNPQWAEKMEKLQDINWTKKNKDWKKIGVITNNTVISNRQARASARDYIAKQMGVHRGDDERGNPKSSSTTQPTHAAA